MYGRPLLFYHFQIAFGAVPDPGSRRSDSIAGEMSVTCCRLNLRVAQKLPDHRQARAERHGTRGKGMA